MKIAILKSSAFGYGGVSRVIESWARILGSHGHSVSVITLASRDAIPVPSLSGVTARTFAVEGPTTRLGRLRAISRAAGHALAQADREGPIDLVVSHDPYLCAHIRRTFRRKPQLLTFHSPFVEENRLNNWKYTRSVRRRATYPATWAAARWIERLGLRAASCVHTLSDYTWNLLCRRHAGLCRTTAWQRIPGTFDDARFVRCADRRGLRKRLGLDPHGRILLTVRRLVPRNGVDRILAAAARYRKRRDVAFLIGGKGELLEPLRSQIQAECLTDTVRLLGLIPEADLPAYYQAADAFLLPTRDLECFGLPVIEAMACGCAPLVMPEGGPAEICRPFPRCVAAANSTSAFADLVADYLAGEVRTDEEALASYAHRTFSEQAVQPAILELVDRLGPGAP